MACPSAPKAARSACSPAASIHRSPRGDCSAAASPSTTSSAISADGSTSSRRCEIAKCLSDRWQAGTQARASTRSTSIPVSREIQAKITTRYWQIILKRIDVARRRGRRGPLGSRCAIVTGEAIGQVSSQTLQNLSVIEAGARYPILRPLVGNNKEEIIAEAKPRRNPRPLREGRRVLRHRPVEAPRDPCPHLDDVLEEEAKLDPGRSGRGSTRMRAAHYQLGELDLVGLGRTRSSRRTRSRRERHGDRPSPEGRLHDLALPGRPLSRLPERAPRRTPAFDPGQRYVLYCEFGLKSAHLADLMRRAGLDARHVSGGLREVRRLAKATPD